MYKIDETAQYVIGSARLVSMNFGTKFIPKQILFLVLYAMPNTPMYSYFISKGIKEEDMKEKQLELLNELLIGQEEFDIVPFSMEEVTFFMDKEIVDIIEEAGKIAVKEYGTELIGVSHLTAAFSKLYPEEFSLIMRTFIPTIESRNSGSNMGGMQMLDFELPRSLSSFLKVLNTDYDKDSKECHICGRDKETKSLIKILMKTKKRNAVLVGDAGVGKTALVEMFTWMIVTGNCPQQLKDSIVLSLDVNAIVAGTQYRGSAEDRFKKLIQFLEENPKCILFVDEIHLLLGAGACRDGDLDLANALKPMLARGETRVIGATTADEYEKYFSKDSALRRRFERIEVREPKSYEVYDMIKNQIKLLEKAHNTTISRELVDAVILKAACFNFQTKNPDRTLDLLDKTMVCAELEGRRAVTEADILDNFNVNQKKFDNMRGDIKTATAYHEAGHYILYRFTDELTEMSMLAVSIIPAEKYLGVNVYDIDSDITPSNNKNYYIQYIGTLLAGRIAEKMYSKTLTAGASSDLERATKIARDVVTRYGLDEGFSQNFVVLSDDTNHMYNEQMITDINERIKAILDEGQKYAEELLMEKSQYLNGLAKALIEKGMLSNNEIDKLFKEIELSM